MHFFDFKFLISLFFMSFTGVCEEDNWETPLTVWRQLLRIVPEFQKIWDPFYCHGRSKIYIEDCGKEALHQDQDCFKEQFPEGNVALVTNPPFSQLEKVIPWIISFKKKAVILLPLEVLYRDWWIQAVTGIPLRVHTIGRVPFLKRGQKKGLSPFIAVAVELF